MTTSGKAVLVTRSNPGVAPNGHGTAAITSALVTTLGFAAAAWIVAVRQMNGMDMGVATRLGSFGSFLVLWVAMMAAMMLPGAVPAVLKGARANGRMGTAPLFVGSYLFVWTLIGLAVFALYRPHGSMAAGVVTIIAGCLRAHAAEAVFSAALSREHPLWVRVWVLLLWFEHRADADVGSTRRHERHLDDCDRCSSRGSEAPACKGHNRCPTGTADSRVWGPRSHRAIFGTRAPASDVKRQERMSGTARWAVSSITISLTTLMDLVKIQVEPGVNGRGRPPERVHD